MTEAFDARSLSCGTYGAALVATSSNSKLSWPRPATQTVTTAWMETPRPQPNNGKRNHGGISKVVTRLMKKRKEHTASQMKACSASAPYMAFARVVDRGRALIGAGGGAARAAGRGGGGR